MSGTIFFNERQTRTPNFDTANTPASPTFFANLIRAVFVRKPDSKATTIIVTAPERGCGVSFCASCIVVELASYGGRILLADAQVFTSIHDPKSAFTLCEQVGPGRVSVLGHHQIPHEDTGSAHPLASPLAVVEALQQEFTHIVIDAPALCVSDVALLLAASATGVILVTKAGKTETQTVTSTYNRFVSLGAHVFGSIYNAH